MATLLDRFLRQVPAGTVLFSEGEAGREMFVIQSGRVRISRVVRGQEKLLAEVGAGEFFGEMSIINDKPRTATATAVEDCQLLALDPKTFEAMIKANGEIAVRLIRKLARRLDEANAQIENLSLGDANSRIVHALLQLVPTAPRDASGVPQLATTVVELAARTNLDEPKAEEVLARLERSRLLLRYDAGVAVPDPQKLQEFLEFLEMRQRFADG